jgi:hypothetical protein
MAKRCVSVGQLDVWSEALENQPFITRRSNAFRCNFFFLNRLNLEFLAILNSGGLRRTQAIYYTDAISKLALLWPQQRRERIRRHENRKACSVGGLSGTVLCHWYYSGTLTSKSREHTSRKGAPPFVNPLLPYYINWKIGTRTSGSNQRTMDVKNKSKHKGANKRSIEEEFFFSCRLQNELCHFNWILIRFLKEELHIKIHGWNIMTEEKDAHYKSGKHCLASSSAVKSIAHFSFRRRSALINNRTWFSGWMKCILMSFLCCRAVYITDSQDRACEVAICRQLLKNRYAVGF